MLLVCAGTLLEAELFSRLLVWVPLPNGSVWHTDDKSDKDVLRIQWTRKSAPKLVVRVEVSRAKTKEVHRNFKEICKKYGIDPPFSCEITLLANIKISAYI